MTRRALRNALLLAAAAVAASLEAPRLAREPLTVATAQLTAMPEAIESTIGTAVQQIASTFSQSHLGFDTNIYPGDKAMEAWKQSGEYEWVGYYLEAPCHKDASWSGTRARLTAAGWGQAVIYVGQQTWGGGKRLATTMVTSSTASKSKKSKRGQRRSAHRMTRRTTQPVATTGDRCSASFVGAAQGRLDARDAIAKAAREGFARGTVVFLDVEHMDAIPQRMRDYYRAWTTAVLADGRYRPGIYAHTTNANTIFDDVSDGYAQAGVEGEPPFWVAGSSGFSAGRLPSDVGHAFASVWQGVLDVVRTHNGVRLPIDISVASAASPSRAVE
jgi:hypothetical protein